MLQSAINAGIQPAWFVADEVYSRDASFWRWLEQTARQPYVLTVNRRQPTLLTSKLIMPKTSLAPSHPRGGSDLTGGGNEERRVLEWAHVELSCRQPEGFSRWFLLRRCPEHPDEPSFISYQVLPQAALCRNHDWGCRSTVAGVFSIQKSTRLGRL